LKYKLPKIQETVRKYKAVLYWEDEASVQLSPVIGKTWAPKGETPVIEVTSKRGSIAAISAISLSGHLIFRLYDKKINSDVIIEFLKQMLDYHPKRHLVVIMDNASSHTSKKTTEFITSQKRLHVFTLPPYSPEFNPDEKVWNYLKNEKLKDHKANNKAELKKLVNKSLKSMSQDKNLLEGLFYRCNVAYYMK
jgi:transposase